MPSKDKITLHIVDDEQLVRNSLDAVLRFGGYDVTAFPSGIEFLDALSDAKPDCVFLDVQMPQMSGLDVLKTLKGSTPDLPVIVMSGFADVSMAVEAMKLGAADFIEKPFQHEDVLETLDRTLQNSGSLNPCAASDQSVDSPINELSKREMEVLSLLVQGKQNKEVARDLEISPRTVEVHRARIMQRLDVTNFAELVRLAVTSGIEFD